MDIFKVLFGRDIDKKKKVNTPKAHTVLLKTKFELKFIDTTLIELPVTHSEGP